MRTAALTFILMLLSQGCSAQTGRYLIALMGQSNMEGRGELSELPAGFPMELARSVLDGIRATAAKLRGT